MLRTTKLKYILNFVICIMLVLIVSSCINEDSKISYRNEEVELSQIIIRPLLVEGEQGNFKEIKLEKKDYKLPQEFLVFKVIKYQVNKEIIKRTVQELELNGELVETDEDFYVTAKEGNFLVDKFTGSYKYLSSKIENENYGNIQSLLDEKEYINKAKIFLKEKDLILPNMSDKGVVAPFEKTERVDSDGAIIEETNSIGVTFKQNNLNGVKIKGVEPKIKVLFDNNGDVVGALSVWRNFEAYKNYPLISLNEAIEKIKKNEAYLRYVSKDDTGLIDEIEIVYFNDPLGYKQKYLIPFYLMKGKATGDKIFEAYIPAISSRYIKIEPVPGTQTEEDRSGNRKEEPEDPIEREKAIEQEKNPIKNDTREIEQRGVKSP